MKTKIFLLSFLFIFLVSAINYGQVGSILRNRVNKAINKSIENKIDTAVSQKVNETENVQPEQPNQPDQPSQAQPQGPSKGMGLGILGGKSNVAHDDEYSFTGRMIMQMEAHDKNEVIRSEYHLYFSNESQNAGMEVKPVDEKSGESVKPGIFLFDNKNRCFMMLMGSADSKTGIISQIPDDSTLERQSKNENDLSKAIVTKTGRTRTIAGYRCDEYKVTEAGEEGYSNVYMTKDFQMKTDKKNWNKAGIPAYTGHPEFENSVMLAFDTYDKNNKPVSKMETKEINENFKHSISTAGYALIKMNFFQMGKK